MRRERTCTPLVSALAVGSANPDQSKLETICLRHGWQLTCARTRAEARTVLGSTPIGVVIVESDLPEGGWKEMLADLRLSADPPVLVVTARLADEWLWAEVLNMGGYDVLARPLDSEEVTRVIGSALRHFDNEHQIRPRPASKAVVMPARAMAAKAAEVA